MTRTACVLPDGCQSKKEFLLRLMSLGWGEKHSPSQIVDRVQQEHSLAISESLVYRTKVEYYQSLGKKCPIAGKYHRMTDGSNGYSSPVQIVQQFAQSVKACGGVAQARVLLDLLEGGVS